MNVQVPILVRVKQKTDLEVVNRLRPLMEAHGLRIASFVDRVYFFRVSELSKQGEVPIQYWYSMGRKEFQLFTQTLFKVSDLKEDIQLLTSGH